MAMEGVERNVSFRKKVIGGIARCARQVTERLCRDTLSPKRGRRVFEGDPALRQNSIAPERPRRINDLALPWQPDCRFTSAAFCPIFAQRQVLPIGELTVKAKVHAKGKLARKASSLNRDRIKGV
jgi:hypothetical protein